MATPLPESLKYKSKSQLMFMDLKTLIKNEKRPQFPADSLDLYKVDMVNTKGDKSAQRPSI